MLYENSSYFIYQVCILIFYASPDTKYAVWNSFYLICPVIRQVVGKVSCLHSFNFTQKFEQVVNKVYCLYSLNFIQKLFPTSHFFESIILTFANFYLSGMRKKS